MPTKLTDTTIDSNPPDEIGVCETKVSRIEAGGVKPSDLFIPFTAGMQVTDTIEGVTYVADAQGNAVAPVKLDPNVKDKPPEGWPKHPTATAAGGEKALSMASRFSPEDRKRLDAERKGLDEKNGQQRTAFETALKVMRSSARRTNALRPV